jgi:hypothetical protein
VSLIDVFDRPVQGRHFFEAIIRENLDLGRPDRVGLLFPLPDPAHDTAPTFGYRTRVITDGVQPSLHVEYKHSHVKQYFKEQHALRTETTINDPNDFYGNKGIAADHKSACVLQFRSGARRCAIGGVADLVVSNSFVTLPCASDTSNPRLANG